jgi:beta-phosphoglucomutase-like phosphatase (HAD superfamily)
LKTPVTHVIFDFDGTLVNSMDAYINEMRNYAKSHGKELSPEVESN